MQADAIHGIPMASIAHWLDANGILNGEARLEYVKLIRAMDTTWMQWHARNMVDRANRKRKSR